MSDIIGMGFFTGLLVGVIFIIKKFIEG